ncbi:MAG: cohesin domain-containing protein [Candidatus Roizmanbacteria bacterium]|nr:cohesin domain-containing protein [Candidatus Roizmanbacteria bacterium]
MKNLLNKIFITAIFFIVVPVVFSSVSAASLKFDKTTVSVSNGGTFQIAVTVDPGSDALNSVDAYVTFDASVLKATAVTAGSLFPTVSHDESTAGKVYIAGMVNDPASSISVAGTLATITFQGLKDGSATLSFDCNTSKIVKDDINASNVLVCSQNNSAAVTVGSGGGSSPPSELPESGVFDNVVKLVIPGMILLLMGGILRLIL